MKDKEISTYEFNPDMKDYVHRAGMEKLLKEIKSLLAKNKKIKLTITE